MFGDPVTNSKEWTISELSKYIQFLTSGSRGWAQYFADAGEYFITIKNVKDCRIVLNDVQYVISPNNAEAKRTRVQEGDLLISITADLGRTGVVTKDIANYGGYINQHLTCIRLKQDAVRPLYVAYYFESEAGKSQFREKNQSAVKAGLNFNAINSLRLIVPPIKLQDEFIAFVEQVDKSKFELKQSLVKLEMLKKSLMQQYFG
jgi:type I restriction enzyme S subunit